MNLKLILYTLLLAPGLFLSSCLKEAPEEFSSDFIWNPELAFPVGETSLGMNAASGFDTVLLNMNNLTGYPLWVERLDIPIEGSTSFNLADIFESNEQINRVLLRVNANNGFPAEVLLQAYFLGSNGILIDSFFLDQSLLLPAGSLIGSGETVSPSYTRKDVVFSRERIDLLENAEAISFKATILNAEIDSTLIDFYPGYSIDIQIGAMLELIFE